MKTIKKSIGFTLLMLLLASSPSWAEEFRCEVLAISGNAYLVHLDEGQSLLKEGDLLNSSDQVEILSSGWVDLGFDKDWQNVVRIESGSRVKIASVYPTKLMVQSGGVFAKLKQLPSHSSFEVQTPTAIGAVRGTEYRVTFSKDQTEIFNFSDSSVYIYGLSENGQRMGESLLLAKTQKSNILKNKSPEAPKAMTTQESQIGEQIKSELAAEIVKAKDSGRSAKIQDISTMEKSTSSGNASTRIESKVVDTRRRSFK